MSRRTKQVVYGIFYLAVLSIIVTVIYFLFLRPSPSCFDNIKNEGETGVDCGGPCARLCIPSSIRQITTLGNVQVFSPLAGHVSVLAELENANADFGASSFDYTVTLYGADGSSTVATLTGSSFAYADEIKYIAFPNEAVPAPVYSANIAVSNVQWVPADQMGYVPQFGITNQMAVASGNGYVTVSGNLTDRDAASFKNIIVMAIFENAAGAPIGASQTELDSIKPGTTQSFSISYPILPNENVSKTELHAYASRQ